jgi:hypothetical protein
MNGLFTGVNPELVRQQEMEKRQGNNLALAQSKDPFASTMFTGLNLADELRNKVADVFGNPIADSPAVEAAKEEKMLEEEVAKMVFQGRQAGKTNAMIATEVQQFLAGRGKFNKAEQYRTQIASEEQTAAKTEAEIEAKKAQALKDTEAAGRPAKTIADRVAGLKKKFPTMDQDIAQSFAQDESAFKAAMVGEKVETAEGVFLVTPDGNKIRIGSPVDRKTTVSVDVGTKAALSAAGPELIKTQSALDEIPGKIKAVDNQIKAVQGKPMITGAFAEQKIAIANAFASAGLSTPENMEKLTNSQTFTAAQKNLVLKDLDNKLGSAISDGDRKFIESKFGELNTNPKALEEILTRIRDVYLEDARKLQTKEKRLLTAVNSGKVTAVEDQQIPAAPVAAAKPSNMPTKEEMLKDPEFLKYYNKNKKPTGVQ